MVTNTVEWGTTVGDDTRLKRMTNMSNTGTVLAALDKTKYGVMLCTATGGGLTIDHVYLCNTAGDALIDLTAAPNLANIFADNPKVIDLVLTRPNDLYEASWATPVYWIKTVTSTGSVENKTDGTTGERSIRLRPNATSGSGSTISLPHLKLDFGQNFLYQTKLQIETFSSLALHTGVGADDITAADSNTRKVQAEVCTVTNNNYWLRNANGTANSASDTGIAATANRVGIRIKHTTSEDSLQIDAGTLLQKSSNVATSGATADNNLIKHSVKNSTGLDRPLLYYGSRLVYTVADNWV